MVMKIIIRFNTYRDMFGQSGTIDVILEHPGNDDDDDDTTTTTAINIYIRRYNTNT